MFIGFSLDGRSGNPDLQAIPMGADNFILTGTWLDIYVEKQTVIVPGIKPGFHRRIANCGP